MLKWWKQAVRVTSRFDLQNKQPLLVRCGAPALSGSSTRVAAFSSSSRAIAPFAAPSASNTSWLSLILVSTASALLLSQEHQFTAESKPKNMTESAAAIKAEELYFDNSYDRKELLEYLKKEHQATPQDVGVAWRLARAAYDVAHLNATSADDKKKLIYYAHDISKKALELNKEHDDVQKWYGVILSAVGDYEGTKVSIANAYIIKAAFLKAIEINPNNAGAYHCYGKWCVAIAGLGWLERKAASVLFGTPPESSYDEALQYFLKYEEVCPKPWTRNRIAIANTYYKQKQYAKAKEYCQKCLEIPAEKEEDHTYHAEAKALLKKL